MVYLLGSQLPNNKKLNKSLTSIFGIGQGQSNKICKKLGFSPRLKAEELTQTQRTELEELAKKLDLTIKGDLKRVLLNTKKESLSIRLYKAVRSRQGFPVRGQRTHTNAKTAKKIR